MRQGDDTYTYLDAGFDRFFNRGIIGGRSLSLLEGESGGGNSSSRAINYDAANVSGSLGDSILVGRINLDGRVGNIDVADSEGRVTVRLSSEDE